jgi:hypothetical protein
VSLAGAESRFAIPPSDGVLSPPPGAPDLSPFGAFTPAGLPIDDSKRGIQNR